MMLFPLEVADCVTRPLDILMLSILVSFLCVLPGLYRWWTGTILCLILAIIGCLVIVKGHLVPVQLSYHGLSYDWLPVMCFYWAVPFLVCIMIIAIVAYISYVHSPRRRMVRSWK